MKKNEKKKKVDLMKEAKKIGKKKVTIGSIVVVVIITIIVGAFILPKALQEKPEQKIVSESTLEKVVKSSTLSTYQTVYNGIATVMNEKKPDKIDYYISYEATVKAGLDFEKIAVKKDDENKKIIVLLPDIILQDPVVPIEKIEYIIVNKKVDENGLVAEAYKHAIADVKEESSKQEALLTYAALNAENLIKGLLSPFIDQLEGYEIEFE